jgi:hypothetical protein
MDEPLLGRATSVRAPSSTDEPSTQDDRGAGGDAVETTPPTTPTLGARAPSLKLKLARQDAQKVVTVVNYKVTSNIKFRLLLCECVSGFAASARAWVIDRVWCWRSARGVSHDVWRRDARAWRCVRVGGTVYRECAVLVGETRD